MDIIRPFFWHEIIEKAEENPYITKCPLFLNTGTEKVRIDVEWNAFEVLNISILHKWEDEYLSQTKFSDWQPVTPHSLNGEYIKNRLRTEKLTPLYEIKNNELWK